jgi:hypothetical protein
VRRDHVDAQPVNPRVGAEAEVRVERPEEIAFGERVVDAQRARATPQHRVRQRPHHREPFVELDAGGLCREGKRSAGEEREKAAEETGQTSHAKTWILVSRVGRGNGIGARKAIEPSPLNESGREPTGLHRSKVVVVLDPEAA